MLNESMFAIVNQTIKPSVLIIKGTIQAEWIKSWNIGILTYIVAFLIIWNIILTYKLNKLKELGEK
jgi:hypothetical protein